MKDYNSAILKLSHSAFRLIKVNTLLDCFLLPKKCNSFHSSIFDLFFRYLWWRCIPIYLSKSILHEFLHSDSFLPHLLLTLIIDYLKLLKTVGVIEEPRLILLYLILNGHSQVFIIGLKLSHH
jgi:hypothetical protein